MSRTQKEPQIKGSKHFSVSMPAWLWEIVEKDLTGKFGANRSDVVRNIVVAFLATRGYPQVLEAMRVGMEASHAEK